MNNSIEISALWDQLQEKKLSLESIYLDPNNPRFVGPDWSYVSMDKVAEPEIQRSTTIRLTSKFGVEKLADNMRVNGYLPIDRIIVKKLPEPENSYVVLEGNRRICAAKLLTEVINKDSNAASESVKESLFEIPVLEYFGEDEDAAWVFQGLRHITGISEWPAFNKAKLLVEQMERDELNLTQVGMRFGLTPHGAGQWVRGYRAFHQAAENSDFIHEMDVAAYPYFQELFSRSNGPIREWMDWNESAKCFDNALNFNEYISWLYPRNEDDEQPDAFGSFESRLLKTRDDVRKLSYLIKEDREAFNRYRESGDVERAYSESVSKKHERDSADIEKELWRTILKCKSVIENIPFRLIRDDATKSRLDRELGELKEIIESIL